jgi:hypothetical protein
MIKNARRIMAMLVRPGKVYSLGKISTDMEDLQF